MRWFGLGVALLLAGVQSAVAGDPALTPKSYEEAGGATAEKTGELSAKMADTLRKAGFTDLKVMTNSILVRGKNKAGQPIAMVLHPDSMTEVVTLDPHSGSAAAGDGTEKPLLGSSSFVTVLPTARMASTLVGLKVRNSAGENLGTIEDLAIDHNGITAYIVAIGGALSITRRYAAVAPKAVEIDYDAHTNAYRARMDATSSQLEAAPRFAYEGSLNAGRK